MATISLNINYVGMLYAEKIVIGEAKVVKRGRGTVFLEGNVKDDVGNLAATCTGIYKLRQKK
jgi:acyl-coenzyme A thioesterase PaaI-like protein